MKRLPLLIAVLSLLLGALVLADAPEETLTALEESVIPARDRVELAQRLSGVQEIPPPPTEGPQWQLGDTQTFWVFNESENTTFQVEAELVAAGEHIYLWVQTGLSYDSKTFRDLAQLFDQTIYDRMHDLWGSEAKPGIDGDPHVYGLFAYGQGPGLAAYFSSENTNPVEAVPNSNEHEMFFFNLDTLGLHFSAASLAGTMAHEFQHMIQANLDRGEFSWVDEGFSTFSEIYSGFDQNSPAEGLSFLSQPQTQLDDWPEDGPRAAHYGASMMFITYFYDRFGKDALHALGQNTEKGMQAINSVLESRGEGDADSLFADWVLANFLQDTSVADGRYGYNSLRRLGTPFIAATTAELPFEFENTLNQYGSDYIMLSPLPDARQLHVHLDAPTMVPLVPTEPASGSYMWYSNYADNSDTTLTHRFDLHGVDSATLNFKLWYHIERYWDYGYVLLSTDDGASWTFLRGPHHSDDNPHGTAYGPGYTGSSEGWVDESISLDDYVGQDVLLRFEMITDDATLQPGMVIDDVSIPEIGYSSDFESGDGGWKARGWVRIDNMLPQQVWVQVIQRSGANTQITRWHGPVAKDWTLPLRPDADQVVLAISPFAALTTVPMHYTLDISAD